MFTEPATLVARREDRPEVCTPVSSAPRPGHIARCDIVGERTSRGGE
jgi:hypothetical protein